MSLRLDALEDIFATDQIRIRDDEFSVSEGVWQEFNDLTVQQQDDYAAFVVSADLAIYRATLTPFVRAFRSALLLVSATDGTSANLRVQIDAFIATTRATDPYAAIVDWHDNVTQIVRAHPDMDGFAALFSQSPEQVDALCEIAMAIEGTATTQEISDLVAAYEAL